MGDLIYRQDALRTDCFGDGHEGLRAFHSYHDYRLMREYLESLPSAEPERKKGKWIKMSDADGIYYCCSECGEELYRKWSFDRDYDLFPKKESIERTNFCQNCGSYNGGE